MTRKEAIERIKARFDKWALDDEDMKAIQTLIPELRESEDERIRKLLVWQVHRNIEDETNDLAGSVYDGIKGHDPDLEESIEDWKKCLAWLEKQKEPKHDATDAKSERVIKAARSVLNNWLDSNYSPDVSGDFAELEYAIREYDGEEKQKEHQNKSDAREKALGGHFLTFLQDKDKNLDKIAQDYVDGVKEYNPEPTWDLMQTAVCYGYHLAEQKQDEGDFTIYHPQKNGEGKYEYIPYSFYGSLTSFSKDKDLIDFLRTCFYTKEECNEWIKQQKEQKPNYNNLPIEQQMEAAMIAIKGEMPSKSQKWSEEDNEMYINVASSLRGYACGLENEEHKKYIQKGLDWLENRFKSLFPSWKPSEGQMVALDGVIVNCKLNVITKDLLVSLYNDLKKL